MGVVACWCLNTDGEFIVSRGLEVLRGNVLLDVMDCLLQMSSELE